MLFGVIKLSPLIVTSGETALHSGGIFRLFALAAATCSIAGAAAGAADTLDTAFLRPAEIAAGQSENDRDYRENDEIFHTLTSFRSARIRHSDAFRYSEPKQSRWQPE